MARSKYPIELNEKEFRELNRGHVVDTGAKDKAGMPVTVKLDKNCLKAITNAVQSVIKLRNKR